MSDTLARERRHKLVEHKLDEEVDEESSSSSEEEVGAQTSGPRATSASATPEPITALRGLTRRGKPRKVFRYLEGLDSLGGSGSLQAKQPEGQPETPAPLLSKSVDSPSSSDAGPKRHGKESKLARKAEGRKPKKVTIACVFCRRSHMTCDDSRPCKRCHKRGISHLCRDEEVQPGLTGGNAAASKAKLASAIRGKVRTKKPPRKLTIGEKTPLASRRRSMTRQSSDSVSSEDSKSDDAEEASLSPTSGVIPNLTKATSDQTFQDLQPQPFQFLQQIEMQQQQQQQQQQQSVFTDRPDESGNRNLLDELLNDFPSMSQPLAFEWDSTALPFVNAMSRNPSAMTMTTSTTATTAAEETGGSSSGPSISLTSVIDQRTDSSTEQDHRLEHHYHSHQHLQQPQPQLPRNLPHLLVEGGSGGPGIRVETEVSGLDFQQHPSLSPAVPSPSTSTPSSSSASIGGGRLLTPIEYAAMKLNQQQLQSPTSMISDADLELLKSEDQLGMRRVKGWMQDMSGLSCWDAGLSSRIVRSLSTICAALSKASLIRDASDTRWYNESLISQQLHQTILSSTDQSQPPTFLANRWGDIKTCNLAFSSLVNNEATSSSQHPVEGSLLSILSAPLSVSIFEHLAQLIREPALTSNPTRLTGQILVKRTARQPGAPTIKIEDDSQQESSAMIVSIACHLSLHVWLDDAGSPNLVGKQPNLLVGVLSPIL